jgi:hypothetical protein
MAGCREPVQTTSDGGGQLLVWEQPNPMHRYVIGADPAEGLLKGDYSAAVVLDLISGTEAAALRGKWEPATFARLLSDLGWHYGAVQGGVVTPALLGVESNNHGHACLLALRNYPNLYSHTEYNATTEGVRPGWLTTTRSKPIMIDTLAAAIRERRPYRWRIFIEEAMRYVVDDKGQTGASGDYHDDTVIAAAIAEQMRLWRPAQAEVISLADELGAGPLTLSDLLADAAPGVADRGRGWTIVNDFGRTIDPWSPTGFSGAVDDRY